MADAYTGVGASLTDQTAYDLAVYHGLRQQLYFDALADVQSTNQSFNGAAVKFTILTDLSPATTTLNESTDVDATILADSQVTLTLAEYGAAVITTKLLRSTSFVPFNPVAANAVAWQAGISQDALAVNVLKAGSNVRFSTGTTGAGTAPAGRTSIEPEDVLSGNAVRRAVAELRGANVMDFGGFYAGFIHPDVAYDFTGATGGANWRDPHTYSAPRRDLEGRDRCVQRRAFRGDLIGSAVRRRRFVDNPDRRLRDDHHGTSGARQGVLALRRQRPVPHVHRRSRHRQAAPQRAARLVLDRGVRPVP